MEDIKIIDHIEGFCHMQERVGDVGPLNIYFPQGFVNNTYNFAFYLCGSRRKKSNIMTLCNKAIYKICYDNFCSSILGRWGVNPQRTNDANFHGISTILVS